MAQDPAVGLNYYICIDRSRSEDLASIRHWRHLRMANNGEVIWIKDLDNEHINGIEVKSLPFKDIYYEKDGKLYRQHSRLPERNVPALLWSSIDRVLAVSRPSYNSNYFGMDETINMQLVPTDELEEAAAMITTCDLFSEYIGSAPAIRMRDLRWTLLNASKVLVLGKPILPLDGDVYWNCCGMLLPAGFRFDLHVLSKELATKMESEHDALIVWNKNNTYFTVERSALCSLTRASVRLTLVKYAHT